MTPMSLNDARINGNRYYFTGKPCVRGHTSERLVANQTCRACIIENKKRHYQKNADKIREDNKARYLLQREDRLAYNFRSKLKTRYGMTVEDSDTLFASQGGKCAICLTALDRDDARQCLDHCHSTGKVRGFLCGHCNSGLGYFNDNPAILRAAADYLDLHGNSIVPQVAAEILKSVMEAKA